MTTATHTPDTCDTCTDDAARYCTDCGGADGHHYNHCA